MIIEFSTPPGNAFEKLVNTMRSQLLELSHLNKEISRAEVLLKEIETINSPGNKVCEIRLSVYGDDLLVRIRTDKFEGAAAKAMREIKKMVKEQVKKQDEPPDKMTSTVKV